MVQYCLYVVHFDFSILVEWLIWERFVGNGVLKAVSLKEECNYYDFPDAS